MHGSVSVCMRMRCALCGCDIYHDFWNTIVMYGKVFEISVSNVSNVSTLYFSRALNRHVSWYASVSSVENQRMYTL